MAAIIVAIVIVAIVISEIAMVICFGELHVISCHKLLDTTATLVA
jgi:hypothetical protein